jgi:hypothetical protein
MADTNQMGYWIPASGKLDQMDRAILSCNLSIHQAITSQAILKSMESKLVLQMTELGKADLLPMLEAHSQSLADMATDHWAVAEELMSPIHFMISQLDLAKENQNWQAQIALIDKAEIKEMSQNETLEQLLNA